jgi:hypothetical protein
VHEESIDFHLKEALIHLETALNQSIRTVLENEGAQKEIAPKWEHFLGQFFGMIKEKGKKARVNPLGWISFAKLR